jgi:ribosomal-protein-alanine N-acetyltransferase
VPDFVTESDGRVTLICATVETLIAEDDGGAALAAVIGHPVAAEWPPEHNDEGSRAWFRRIIEDHPADPGFGAWYVMADNLVVGTAGYKGPPTPAGEVEIGYAVVPSAQRRGHGTAATAVLVARAFRDTRVTAVLAETLPSLPASQKVLLTNGFDLVGNRVDPEEGDVLCFRRSRESA